METINGLNLFACFLGGSLMGFGAAIIYCRGSVQSYRLDTELARSMAAEDVSRLRAELESTRETLYDTQQDLGGCRGQLAETQQDLDLYRGMVEAYQHGRVS